MTPGSCVAIGVATAFGAGIVFGLWCDVREWLADRDRAKHAAQSRRATKVTAESPEERAIRRLQPLAEAMRDDLDYFAELCGLYAPTAAEIKALPTVEPRRWWVA